MVWPVAALWSVVLRVVLRLLSFEVVVGGPDGYGGWVYWGPRPSEEKGVVSFMLGRRFGSSERSPSYVFPVGQSVVGRRWFPLRFTSYRHGSLSAPGERHAGKGEVGGVLTSTPDWWTETTSHSDRCVERQSRRPRRREPRIVGGVVPILRRRRESRGKCVCDESRSLKLSEGHPNPFTRFRGHLSSGLCWVAVSGHISET